MKKLYFYTILCVIVNAAAQVDLATYDNLSTPSVPYAYSLRSKSTQQLLEYIGTDHTKPLTHKQYNIIDKRLKEFLKNSGQRQISIIEAVYPQSYSSKEEAYNKLTDCGYANWISSQNNIPVIDGELSHQAVIQQIIQEFGKEAGYYFAFAQAISFEARNSSKQGDPTPSLVQSVREWTEDNTVTWNSLKDLHKKFTGLDFPTMALSDFSDMIFFSRLMDLSYHTSFMRSTFGNVIPFRSSIPSSVAHKFYPMLRRSHQIRDNHTLAIITEQWNQKKNIFIVYGALHAAALKKSLQNLVNQPH